MKTSEQDFRFKQKVLLLALLAAHSPAHAEDDEVARLIKPDSSVVSLGLGAVAGDQAERTLFGQYSSWRLHSARLLLDYESIKRDDASGLWTHVELSDLGLDNHELRFSQQKQGDWKYAAQYGQLVRHEPRAFTTGSGAHGNLELKRKSYSLSGEMWILPALSVDASFKSESKEGSRLFGVGNLCTGISSPSCGSTAGAFLLVPEPVDSTTRQFEAKVNYAGKDFLLSGGYYGSFYRNAKQALTPVVPGSVNAELAAYLRQPLALPPDNEAHQFYVLGNYTLTPTTRANFNVAYTQAKQTDDFGSLAVAGAPANLGGELNRTFMQIGLSARPLPMLSVVADWRKEDVKDGTPMNAFANTPSTQAKDNGKLEASYLLPDNYSATAGVDYAYVKRARPIDSTDIPATSLSALREETEELGVRLELKRSLSDTFNAALSVAHSEREGRHFIGLVASATDRYPVVRDDALPVSGTVPFTLMDRKRDKLRAVADWAATEQLALQFVAEGGKDRYTAPTAAGLHDSGMRSAGLDATFSLSDNWRLTGYVNYGEQTLHVDHGTGYIAELKNVTTHVGLGAVGKLSSRAEVGGDLSTLSDRNRYGLGSGNTEAAGVLPDVTYRATSLKLFGKYSIDKEAEVRVDLVHQRLKFDEWTWANAGVPFAYSDNTTVSMQPSQKATFLGARYAYRFK